MSNLTDNHSPDDALAKRWPNYLRMMRNAPTALQKVCDQSKYPGLIIENILIGSVYDPIGEAALQATLIPDNSSRATIYGIGNGELIRHLLKRPQLTHLRVVILNPSVEYLCMNYYYSLDWLSDLRIELEIAGPNTQPETPFAALPAALRLATETSARLRDHIQLELNTPYIRENFKQRSVEFQLQMQANELCLSNDGDVVQLFDSARGRSAIIAAAGPTLAQHYEWIRDKRDQFVLIAVDAALIPLLKANIQPDIVITIDGLREGIYPYFDTDLSDLIDRYLVYFPIVHPDVLQRWPGTRLAAYANHSIYRDIARRLPKGRLFASGTVTHAATDLAVRMGVTRIVFTGADFGFPNGMSHVAASAHAKSIEDTDGSAWVLNGHGQRITTLPNLRAYLRDLEAYIASQPQVTFYNASRDGAHIHGAKYELPDFNSYD